jgi:hypothetical protein
LIEIDDAQAGVEWLIAMDTPDDTRFEVIGNFLNRVDADIARGALEAEGIDATVAADDAAGTRPHLWLSGVRIWVRAEDAERAKSILREAEQATDQVATDEEIL